MLSKIDLINMAKQVWRRDRGATDRRLMHPGRDWMIGLALAAAMFIAGSAWAGYQYIRVTSLSPDVPPPTPITRIDQAQLEMAIDVYAARRATYDAALSTTGVSAAALATTSPAVATSTGSVATSTAPQSTSTPPAATSSAATTSPAE